MCGFAGIVRKSGSAAGADTILQMTEALTHRGPDALGLWSGSRTLLGHRRLSIVDLETGDQPLANETETVWIVFNGEIYNFEELRHAAGQRGHVFRTRSDTETLVHLYEDHGPGMLERLRGMFAFAIWNERDRRLLLARDRIGKKPLYYGMAGQDLVFASEIQSLLRHPDVDCDIDLAALDEYLTLGYVSAPRTIFRGLYKLPPAHYLDFPADHIGLPQPVRYWSLEFEPKLELTDADALAAFEDELSEAVRIRMMGDVPVGALLSGGIDSGLVVALMSQMATGPIQTFSIGFADQRYNELPYAREIATKFGTRHNALVVEPSAVTVLPKLMRHYGEPFADSSAIPTYYLAELTSRHVKVALTGDGGDESLAGYDRYLASLFAERVGFLPAAARRGLLTAATALGRSDPRSIAQRLARFLSHAAASRGTRYARWMTFFDPVEKAALFRHDVGNLLQLERAEQALAALVEKGPNHLDALLHADVLTYLPYDLLVKLDIASMATSLEARSPFLDQRLMAFTARLPDRMKIRGTTKKWLARQLARKFLPPAAVSRKKMGFGVPVATWLRQELRPVFNETVLADDAVSHRWFERSVIQEIAQRHWQGEDRTNQMWSLLCLEFWYRAITEIRPVSANLLEWKLAAGA